MRLHRFYSKEKLQDSLRIVITDEQHIHQWKKVFRYKPGDRVILFDGTGSDYTVEFEYLESREATFKLIEVRASKGLPERNIHICMALTKKDTFEWVVQKGTELGMASIIPVLAERSEKKDINSERIERIIIEASEQCGRGILPTYSEVTSFAELVEGLDVSKLIVWDPQGERFNSGVLSNKKDIYAFIGPEGGWSERELAYFREKGCKVVAFGELTLRAETAALAALTLSISA